ncbi:MAG: DUF3810 domain-containing protein [Ginsengibacter sp.]
MKWIFVVILIILIKVFSSNSYWVDKFYSTGIYPFFSQFLRILFGWIPFSLGDIFYFVAVCFIVWKIIKNVSLLFKKKFSKTIALKKTVRLILVLAFVYIIFYLFWGINYSRKGIAYQLQISDISYDSSDLLNLQHLLLQKVNASKSFLVLKDEKYLSTNNLIKEAKSSYDEAHKIFPFLTYHHLSVKSSMYGTLGDYLGFTGYYNPFTGEAQINTTVPKMLQPYIATHEMAHQLGYAKENEANFVGYLAAVNSKDTLFHYSTYLDLFLYANQEVFYFDSVASKNAMQQLTLPVRQDLEELRQFNLSHRGVLEPLITWIYGNYLKLNNQPKGLHSYNAVIGMLIAYYKKYGKI